jgi:cysteine synthase B
MSSSVPGSTVDRPASSSVLDLIGRTPLVRLHRFEAGLSRDVELYAKVEWQNPGGSVKDRAAARMILEGETSGRLTRDKTILDATSGNTGIAYAMVGASRGYKVKLCVPENASPERKLILKALGAELVLTSPLEGTDGSIRGRAGCRPSIPSSISIRISTATKRTGARTTTRPRRRSSSRRAAG